MAEEAERTGQPPRLLLVTGMSGAGKSTVLDALEDMGWDCVDNLPVALLGDFVRGEEQAERKAPIAVGMDARSRGFEAGSNGHRVASGSAEKCKTAEREDQTNAQSFSMFGTRAYAAHVAAGACCNHS